jgi:hypothetical protein
MNLASMIFLAVLAYALADAAHTAFCLIVWTVKGMR